MEISFRTFKNRAGMRSGQIFFACFLFMSVEVVLASTDSTRIASPIINGYFSEVGSVFLWNHKNPVWDNTLQNRTKMQWAPLTWLDLEAQLRTRFITGETVANTPGYAENLSTDRGLGDLSWNIFSTENTVLNSHFDRLSARFIINRLEITLGRQRINWGQTYVWNPNDIFNAYSFFEFDYPEKPGSDALRIQYFRGIANSLEFVVKSDSGKKISMAGLYRFNRWNYDFQFLGGILDNSDLVAGLGWSGNIG